MPKERKKVLCMDAQRHAEYYGMQQTFDELYAKSKAGEVFNGLMELVLSPDNIMLAYRNIKTNTGSYTTGTDKQNIGDIGRLPPAEVIGKVRKIVTGSEHGYRPKPVRRKDIPKPNGKTRPLGIPCIWDRLVHQCIKQILEPICEAKFSNNSYGFRPNRSVEHAISRTYSLLQRAHLHYVLEFDIKGFFDNVNHSKLIKQLWTLGIQDKQLLFIIKRILKAPIRMPDGSTVYPTKGTPQGGIISPLLANVVLNELDHWIDSQWTEHPVANRYGTQRIIRTSEVFDKSKGYQKMRNSNLKEMFIVRYADDFRIFCRNREDAEKTMEAVTKWITERLKLEVSPEKTRIVNVRKRYSEFLGFKIMVYRKGRKYVVKSHICDKKLQLEESKLVEQAKRIREAEQNDPLLRGRVIHGVADPAIFDESRGESIAAMMERSPHFLHWQPGDHTRLAGKMQFHYRLRFAPDGRPMLQVFSSCKHFIRTLPNLVYDESNVEDIDTRQEDHIYDECRYVLMEHPISPPEASAAPPRPDDPLELHRQARFYRI